MTATSSAERLDRAETRARVNDLLGKGWPLRTIAAVVNIPAGTLAVLARGGSRRVRPAHRDAISHVYQHLAGWDLPQLRRVAVPEPRPAAEAVTATVARVRTAHRWGADVPSIAKSSGLPEQTVRALLSGVAP